MRERIAVDPRVPLTSTSWFKRWTIFFGKEAKRMAKTDKVKAVDEILVELRESEVYFLVDHRGLTVAEATELRNRLRAVGASLKVVKNTLAKRAALEAGVEGMDELFAGPSAIAFCHADPVGPAKVLQTFIREKKKVSIKGGYLQRRILQAAQVDSLATLPSREELVARVVSGIAAPLYGLAYVLSAPMRGLVVALDQIREQKAQAA
jgi:large subunit ribosomal protein L10